MKTDLEKNLKNIEPIILELGGRKIDKIDGVITPDYLFSFPNGIWLSFEIDERDNYFDVKLGRLFSFDDIMPRIIVLEKIEYYFVGVNELKLGKIKFSFSNSIYEIENVFEVLKNNLKIIIENYSILLENEKVKKKILKEEKRLESYLLKDLSNSINLELELQNRIESYNGKINKRDSNKVIKKVSEKGYIINELLGGLVELIFGLVVIAIGFLIYWLVSLKKDVSNVPFEVFIIFGFVAIIVLAFIIGLIVLLVKKDK